MPENVKGKENSFLRIRLTNGFQNYHVRVKERVITSLKDHRVHEVNRHKARLASTD